MTTTLESLEQQARSIQSRVDRPFTSSPQSYGRDPQVAVREAYYTLTDISDRLFQTIQQLRSFTDPQPVGWSQPHDGEDVRPILRDLANVVHQLAQTQMNK